MSAYRVSIGRIEEFAQEAGRLVELDDHRVAVFRIGDDLYAIGDRCSHAEASLSEGEVFDLTVECPRHGSEFDLVTGEPGALPATKPVPVYAVEVIDGEVFLDLPAETET
ncbi:MAG: non-heme iron oxygenase ferredoxin subunit [Acidimicrobiia bacterium]